MFILYKSVEIQKKDTKSYLIIKTLTSCSIFSTGTLRSLLLFFILISFYYLTHFPYFAGYTNQRE